MHRHDVVCFILVANFPVASLLTVLYYFSAIYYHFM